MFEKRDSWLIRVNGIVQGVGFRPFVYNLADKYGLKGFVLNNTEGVTIRVEGEASEVDAFFEDVRTNPPPLAQINGATKEAAEFQGFQEFKVEKSTASDKRTTFIPPDTGVCDECLGEFFDGGDRRFHYPFITCTHCGPRFSIIEDIPYDRATTAMKIFPLCEDCQREYDSPPDRRFHTEPTACGKCGPRLSLFDRQRKLVSTDTDTIARKTVEFLKEGKILAIKGVGGFHLAVDAANDEAVNLLRERKRRPFKPFALMSGSLDRRLPGCLRQREGDANRQRTGHRDLERDQTSGEPVCGAGAHLFGDDAAVHSVSAFTLHHRSLIDIGDDQR